MSDQNSDAATLGANGAIAPHDVSIIIPTLNAGPHLARQIPALALQGFPPSAYLIVDSSSNDNTVEEFQAFGAEVMRIDRSTFNHGGTRKRAVEARPDARFYILLTQDAVPARPDSMRRLLAPFEDGRIGLSYGRQLPRPDAGAIERHARLFSYGSEAERRTPDDGAHRGIKTVFCSNSFAAYRREALLQAGNFPEDSYFAEDQITAGAMLALDWAIAYAADAEVYHSHDYTTIQEFRRYFDVGVFHARNAWLLDRFGRAEGEGLSFIKSEMAYLWAHKSSLIPQAMLRTIAKYAGYRLGRLERRLTPALKQRLSMQPFYWRR
ncbi:glycosyltransferase [Sphingomonas tabacisoli]|uniref:Glycosyltransferase n=1 Tax=Sphingomonas tabacisoli TaxID=2249466 RepID=A0ABW4I522_9SPHN